MKTAGETLTVLLSENATEQLRKLTEEAGVSESEAIRRGLSLFRIYVEAQRSGNELAIINKRGRPLNLLKWKE